MATACDVAQYILKQSGEMTTMKLQKLVYYAQAWHSVWAEKPLFNEPIQAWANGPVCPSLYESHRGQFSISEKFKIGTASNLTKDEKDSIDKVLKHYGERSGQYLSDLTHAEQPWKKARGDLAPGEPSTRPIPLADMAEYYGSL